MAFSSSSNSLSILVNIIMVTMLFSGSSSAALTTSFYQKTCPDVFKVVNSVVKSAISEERRMGASLLRLHFHDCFVNGCDGSVLLDDTPTFTGEKTAAPNNESIRGFNVVDDIKSSVEKMCPNVVSCADILAIAARDSVAMLGGPIWSVKLGRRDSKTASFSDANSGMIPSPTSSLRNLINRYKAKGLTKRDMVALSGAHTIGQARCVVFRDHVYNKTNIDVSFAKQMRRSCPPRAGFGDNNIAPLDFQTQSLFDNKYYKNILSKKVLFQSDQILHNGGSTDYLVERYSKSPGRFHDDFMTAIIKMGDIGPLTGCKGEIRKDCRRHN